MDSGRPIGLAIETKHPTRYAGQVERQLARVLGEFGLDRTPAPGRPWVRVMSFSQLATQRMRQLCPEVPLVFLVEKGSPTIMRYRDGGAAQGRADRRARHRDPARHPAGGPPPARARAPGVRLDRRRGRPTSTCACELGVDAIITNRPAFVRDHAGGRP